MRTSLVLMVYVLCLSLVVGVLVLTVPSATLEIEATVDIHPETLNLKSNGTWITALIELPKDYDVSDINVTTILLDGTVPAAWGNVGGNKLMVKFDMRAVIDCIWFKLYHMGIEPLSSLPKEGVEVELTITGSLDTETIEGSDTIRVIYEG